MITSEQLSVRFKERQLVELRCIPHQQDGTDSPITFIFTIRDFASFKTVTGAELFFLIGDQTGLFHADQLEFPQSVNPADRRMFP